MPNDVDGDRLETKTQSAKVINLDEARANKNRVYSAGDVQQTPSAAFMPIFWLVAFVLFVAFFIRRR